MFFLFGPSGTNVVFQEGQNPGFGPYRTDHVIQKGQSALIEQTACSKRGNWPFWIRTRVPRGPKCCAFQPEKQ